jgi:hypothetical protein
MNQSLTPIKTKKSSFPLIDMLKKPSPALLSINIKKNYFPTAINTNRTTALEDKAISVTALNMTKLSMKSTRLNCITKFPKIKLTISKFNKKILI